MKLSQQAALNETEQIALSGGPGTGKSVVSLYRHLTNHENNNRSLLLTYTTTLARYLSECCRLRNVDASRSVRSAYAGCPGRNENFEEVIIDEAQDLDDEYFDKISRFSNVQKITSAENLRSRASDEIVPFREFIIKDDTSALL